MHMDEKINTQRRIVYVPRRSRIRVYKIAKAVKLCSDFKLILVCERYWYDKDLFQDIFDEVHTYNNLRIHNQGWFKKILRKYPLKIGFKKMLNLIHQSKPDIIHVFCEPYDHIKYILENVNVPVIMSDGADFSGISEGIENLDNKTRLEEKFCFENVAGLVYKGPKSVINFYRNYKYKIIAREMTWFDHSDNDLFVPLDKEMLKNNEEIHLVYSGVISNDPNMAYCYYLPLAISLTNQKIHFHIYPNPYQYKYAPEYHKMDAESEYFHFHKPLIMSELIIKISEYDWGLWIHSEKVSKRTQPSKMRTGMVNKIFTYLEAGLPILVSSSRTFGSDFIESNGIGKKIGDQDWNNIGRILRTLDYSEIKRNVGLKRNEYSLSANGGKLVDFYNNIFLL